MQVRCKKRRFKYSVSWYPTLSVGVQALSHTVREKGKLLNRVSRLRARLKRSSALWSERSNAPRFCSSSPPRRGAMNGLMAEVMEDHIRAHVLNPEHGHDHDNERMRGAEELIDVVRRLSEVGGRRGGGSLKPST